MCHKHREASVEISDIHSLCTTLDEGKKVKFIFFWGHKESGSSISKACFSQWYESKFEHDGVMYLTAEHYMMAEKARLFSDDYALSKILNAKDPGEAKAIGREVVGFDQLKWEESRIDIVVRGNLLKFQIPELREFLINTKNRVLVEASPVDRIWGVGLAQDSDLINNPRKWRGINLLGFALMKVRSMLNDT